GPLADFAAFSQWLADRLKLDDPYSHAIVDGAGRAVGIATLMEIRPAMRVIEVGHIVYSPALQRTPLGTEAQYLLARYAFETLGYRRYEWKCDPIASSTSSPSTATASLARSSREFFVWEIGRASCRERVWQCAVEKL